MSAALATMSDDSLVAPSREKRLPTFKSGKWQLTPERVAVMREHYRPGVGGSKHCAELLGVPAAIVSTWGLALGLRGQPQKGRAPRGSRQQQKQSPKLAAVPSPTHQTQARGRMIEAKEQTRRVVERPLPPDPEAVDALVAIYGRPATDAAVPRLPAEIVETLNTLVLETVRETVRNTATSVAQEITETARRSAEQHASEIAETVVRREHHALSRRIEDIERMIAQLHDAVAEVMKRQEQQQRQGRGLDERQLRMLAMLKGYVWRETIIPESDALSAETDYTLWILAGEQPISVAQVRPGEKLLIGRTKAAPTAMEVTP